MSTTDIQDRLQLALGDAYIVERELGGGGMSRVFVAVETSLGRKVVVKVLRPELAEGLSAERFKREVRLAARLQHPHIVPLLAAGAVDGGVLYYTMPFVEGESLRERLERDGALPVTDTVRVLRDAASALAYAHRAGVVHRDVKPENVLLSDGGAVVADFGIAKAINASREAADADARRSSTTLTAAGTSLGTPAYMAPEQAAGDVVDHRADLYALGVVAYEMLAGRAPFEGRTGQQLLAAHATQDPEPIGRRRASAPAALNALVMRLLAKNPADRPQSADEVLRAVDGAADAGTGRSDRETSRVSTSDYAVWRMPRPGVVALFGLAAALVGAAVGAMLARSRVAQDARQPVIAMIGAPAGQELRPDAGLALSPDGARLALVAADRYGATAVWVRPLDSLAAVRVEGTEGASWPFWSPDGGSLGYFAGGQLKVTDLRARTGRTLCRAPRPGGATWATGGVIVYSPDFLSLPLFKVPAGGGPCTQLTRPRPGEIHRRPSALPDGRHVLFSGSTGANTAFVADLASGAVTDIRTPGGDAQFAAPDWMLFRDGALGPLFAQRLDLRTMRPLGEPRPVLDRIVGVRTVPSYSATARALVAIQRTGAGQSLVWVSRHSQIVDSVRAPTDADGPYFGAASAAVSHDGRRVVFGAGGPMWIYDRDRNVATRARAQTIAGQGVLEPTWGPGDSLIAYRTLFGGPLMLRVYRVRTDASDSLFALGRRNVRTPAWSPDGQRIAFQLSAGDTVAKDEIWIYSFAERSAARAWESAGNLSTPRWSPDGRWLAYVSDETGAPEVYMRPVPGPDVAVRVSAAGGEFPRWRGDGRELYYRSPDGSITAVAVRLGSTAALSTPRVALTGPPFSRTIRSFEVSPDGERFLAFAREDPLLFTLVLDWSARLPAR